MTQTRRPVPTRRNRRAFVLAVIAAVICAVATLIGLALIVMTAQAVQDARVVDTASLHRIDAIPADQPLATSDPLVLAVLGEGSDFSASQVSDLHMAADRVCEGFTAQVPVVYMEPVLMQEFGMSDVAAHDFVIVAHRVQCPLA